MVDLINLTALAPPASLLVSKDTAGVIEQSVLMAKTEFGKHLLSGALTADTYKTLVTISTRGWLRLCGVYRLDATSRTLGLKIVMDGTTVIDDVDAAATLNGLGWFGVGIHDDTFGISQEYIRFNSSLSLQVKSSLSETDKVALVYSVGTG